ncbi:hypothetical protein pEaSNUABM40_00154 [Erwinia phage pEa_SNUABM_40]|uniref:Uncharacterized protein n=1 Tax=Erwinia phage pEa_SNUABM_3 TaxID=2869552 RepID=A0AAE8BYS4_9CAUD|nr:tail sheath [Erwinia phage pEa_SNUABM_3]QZE56689.1 hypothetical protein pEaSNUABM20_00153 [Erwinia phage pEa_SNUABM_20]QZE58370.1 hypothetical protein pEaSNUABM40_00154 [Erwinia phage pEa_SNUABM_40]UAW52934.1 hypothetical protein pEaSNUABM23_00152 [Erwinia phage pEa_SNUABM_23]UIW10830.1 hypothetical protein pEaSNUABM23_00152 [Erwinia phage pEa_SNUABM_31]QZE56350.1 hypothetical protein pEaSNUABM3_00153 [Erwinia phage pEa_SNUABM_3]
MNKLIVKSGFTSNLKMWRSILEDMIANGFQLVSYNGTIASSLPTTDLASFVVEATATIDPLAGTGVGKQRWRLAMKGTEKRTNLFCAAPEQISDTGTVAKTGSAAINASGVPEYAGQIGARFTGNQGAAGDNDVCFYHRGVVGPNTSVYYGGTMAYPTNATTATAGQTNPDSLIWADPEATPFTYHLSFTDHGFALHIGVEGRDSDGCRAAWLVVQRAINSDGTVVVDGKAPLFCMFSVNGGGSINNDIEVRPVTYSPGSFQIMRFTVRESDVNAPTIPAPAHVHSADSSAVINPYQMVPFSEDNHFDFRLPAGFNTQRYSYPYEMDIVGYASADVISNGTEIDVQVYNEMEDDGSTPKKRTYKALTANSPNNTGMRIFFLKGYKAPEGAGA